jgi:hypothetical protein
MSAALKLSSKLPGDPEINGLDSRAKWLEDNPEELLVCIAYVDTAKVTIDTDSGEHIPTVRVRRIEPLGEVSEVPKAVREALAAAEEERTGRKAIPFEVVEVGEHAYGDALPDGDE